MPLIMWYNNIFLFTFSCSRLRHVAKGTLIHTVATSLSWFLRHSGLPDPHFQMHLHMWCLCLFLSPLRSCPLSRIFHALFSFSTDICRSFNHHPPILPLFFFFWFHGFHPSFPVTLAFQDKLCLPHHILEGKGLTKVGFTVQALVDKASSRRDQRRSPCWRDVTWCCHTSDIFSCSSCYVKIHLVKLQLKDERIQ